MTAIISTPACEARTGFYPGEWSEMPLYCQATVGLTTWRDSGGFTHRACRHHRDAMQRRYPVTSITARRDAFEEGRLSFERSGLSADNGTICSLAGHVDGCPGKAGGDHELREGWIGYDDERGNRIEVEVTGA